MGYTSCLPKSAYVSFYQEGIHYSSAQSSQIQYRDMLPDSSTHLIVASVYLYSVVTQFRSRLSRAANLLLKIAFFGFFLSEFVSDAVGSVYIT